MGKVRQETIEKGIEKLIKLLEKHPDGLSGSTLRLSVPAYSTKAAVERGLVAKMKRSRGIYPPTLVYKLVKESPVKV